MLRLLELTRHSQEVKRAQNIRHAFRRKDRGTIGYLEMQMRRGRLSGVAQLAEDRAHPNMLMRPHAKTAVPKMRVRRKLIRTDAKDDVVAHDVGERHRGDGPVRRVVDDRVDRGDDFPITDRDNGLPECPVALVSVLIALIRVAVWANLHPIDREALRDVGSGVDGGERAPMVGRVRRAAAGDPLSAAEWRAQKRSRRARRRSAGRWRG